MKYLLKRIAISVISIVTMFVVYVVVESRLLSEDCSNGHFMVTLTDEKSDTFLPLELLPEEPLFPGAIEEEPVIRSIHVSDMRTNFSGEPFFKPGNLAISWDTDVIAREAQIALGTDPDMSDTVATVRGHGDQYVVIPEKLLHPGSVYYYRVYLQTQGSELPVMSDTRWFAVDSRFTGNRIVSRGYHPLGKCENAVTVRDSEGVIHMAMDRWVGDTGNREVLWLSSADDGENWTNHGPVNLPEHTFSGPASIAMDYMNDFLYIGYLAGDNSCRMPRWVAITRCDLQDMNPTFDTPHVFECFDGLSWRRPNIEVDDNGVAHIAWDGMDRKTGIGVHTGGIEVKYSRNAGNLWQDPISISPNYHDRRGGGSHLVCVGTAVYVFWEAGMWRYSEDSGDTWNPPLDEPAECILPDVSEDRMLRWRNGASTRIGKTDRLALVFFGEHLADKEKTWSGMYNMNEIWITVFDPATGWSDPVQVYALDSENLVVAKPAHEQPVHFIERPSITSDKSETLYIAWDEATGFGREPSEYKRVGYVLSIDKYGHVSEKKRLPDVGHLNNQKPILGNTRAKEGFDIVWTVGDIPSSDARPIRPDGPITIQGIMFATHDNLDQPKKSKHGFIGQFESLHLKNGFDIRTIEPFPKIVVPKESKPFPLRPDGSPAFHLQEL